MSNAHVWRAAQERLRQQMSRAQYETWLRGTWLMSTSDGATILCVRTTFARELLETRFRERIESAIAEVTGHPCALRVAVAAEMPVDQQQESQQIPLESSVTSGKPQLAQRVESHRHVDQLDNQGRSLFESDDAGPEPQSTNEHSSSTDSPLRVAARPVGPRRSHSSGGVLIGRQRHTRGNEKMGSSMRNEHDADLALVPTGDTIVPAVTDVGYSVEVPQSEQAAKWPSTREKRNRIDGTTRMSGQGNRPDKWNGHYGHDGNDRDDDDSQSEPLPQGGYGMPDASNPARFSGGPALRLNPRYTFSTFIVGSGNQLAHAASQAVAEAPGLAYNPLFLYGGVGLGKTHLLHAVGHKAIELGLVVLYVSSETFTNEIVNAIRYRTTEEFRAKYRSVDVLLVDDVQFIAGKDSTEEEFFHTFNALHENSKQIVICSDRPPKAILSLAERLRSRFEWGLIADIQPPDLETRVAILRAKSDTLNRQVPDDVITYLASRVQSNIRELEGSFNRLFAFAQLQHLPLTIDTAKAALASLVADGRQRRVSVAEVLEAVAEHYRLPAEDLCGKQRDKHIVVPRQVAMYLMRQETEASLLEIGQALGGRDHSTVLHGCEKIGREVNDNTTLRKEVMAIRQQLLG